MSLTGKMFLTFFIFFIISVSFSETRTIDVNGTRREYILDIPDSYDGSQGYSLLLACHGMTSNASAIRSYSGFSSKNDEYNYIAVYPQGLDDIENVFIPGTQTTGWKFDVSGNRDVEFTEVLLDSLFNEFNLVDNGVYITGMSNGGFISDIIACNIGDRISAIAPVCGGMGFGSNDCPVTKKIPVMHLGSENDGIVPINLLRSATDFWIEHNGCSTTPENEGFCDVYNDGSDDASEVRHCEFTCMIDGSPAESVSYECHTWPTLFGGYDFSATEMVLEFFESHGLGSGSAKAIFSNIKPGNKREISVSHDTQSDRIDIRVEAGRVRVREISIYDCRGRLIMKSLKNRVLYKGVHDFDIEHLNSGIYILKFELNNKCLWDKVIVSR